MARTCAPSTAPTAITSSARCRRCSRSCAGTSCDGCQARAAPPGWPHGSPRGCGSHELAQPPGSVTVMPVLVGTSGWQYRHWRGAFYPQDIPQRRWLEYYAGQFGTVENNGTFYRLPARETFEQWRARTPDGFVMAVKASRYLSHIRRLRDPAEPVRRMLEAFAGLQDRLGPVLIQLPPGMKADPELLDCALSQYPPDVRVAVEPRHASWWNDRTREVLAAREAALCWAERGGEPVTPLWRTAGWGYL